MKKLYIATVLTALGSLAFALAALSAPTGGTVNVTAGKPSELRFTVLPKTITKGRVTFRVANRGKLVHDFKIAGKKTPTLKPGRSATLTVTFGKAGKYAYLCTVTGHAAGGMKGVLTVK
jgi:uncharacterized cupredoxin-like copper-binding protein